MSYVKSDVAYGIERGIREVDRFLESIKRNFNDMDSINNDLQNAMHLEIIAIENECNALKRQLNLRKNRLESTKGVV